jgi:DNA mismatch repair protein MutS
MPSNRDSIATRRAEDARDGGQQYIAALQEQAGAPASARLKSGSTGFQLHRGHARTASECPQTAERPDLTGADRFVTADLKAYEAKVLGAEERIAKREADLLDALRRRVAEAIGRVQSSAGLLAQLDVWSALADVAEREQYVRPEVNASVTLQLEGSRHPVVERMMPRETFIPNDIALDEAGRVMLLTGPNMAGKSTLLRQVGLCVLLAQMGSFVPAGARASASSIACSRGWASDNLVRAAVDVQRSRW